MTADIYDKARQLIVNAINRGATEAGVTELAIETLQYLPEPKNPEDYANMALARARMIADVG